MNQITRIQDNKTPESNNERFETDAAIRQNNMWQGGSRHKQVAAPAQAQHSPITEREAKLLELRERDAIAYSGLMKGYQETRAIEDKLRNELDDAHNDTFKARAHAQRLADALQIAQRAFTHSPDGVIRFSDHERAQIREALAEWSKSL